MRKHSRKFMLTVWTMIVLLLCSVLLPDLSVLLRVLLVLAAALLAVVWVICESRIDRAAAPLRIQQEAAPADAHPPDCAE